MTEQQTFTDSRAKSNANLKPQWQPGESGNPAGKPKNSVTTLLKNRNPEDNQAIADKLYALALAGDMAAIREYIDRTDGKVDSTLNLKGDVPVTITFVRTETKQLKEGEDATD